MSDTPAETSRPSAPILAATHDLLDALQHAQAVRWRLDELIDETSPSGEVRLRLDALRDIVKAALAESHLLRRAFDREGSRGETTTACPYCISQTTG